jgi:hypothetical protein
VSYGLFIKKPTTSKQFLFPFLNYFQGTLNCTKILNVEYNVKILYKKNINLDHFLFSILAQLLSKMILITISGVGKIFIN